MDGKRKGDGCLEKRGVKVGTAFFKDIFLIVLPYWPTFCLFRTDVGICKKNYIRKGRKYNISTANRDKKTDNLNTSTREKDREANKPETSIVIKNRKKDNLGQSTVDRDEKLDNSSTGIAKRDGRV